MQIKTKGIVLSRRNIGEHDQMITILCENIGIIEASAKFAKSAKSGLASACQILSFCEFQIYTGKSAYHINSAESINLFYDIRLDIIKLSLSSYFCEITKSISPSAENSTTYLNLMLNTLYLLQENKKSIEILKSIFELRTISISGFMPNLVCCFKCNKFEDNIFYLLPVEGFIICSDCYKKSIPIQLKFTVTTPVLYALRHIVFSNTNKLFSFNIKGDSLKSLNYITEMYLSIHIEQTFQSLEQYKKFLF